MANLHLTGRRSAGRARENPPTLAQCSNPADPFPGAAAMAGAAGPEHGWLREKVSMSEYDAIVAGGGPNGLAAAVRLAEAGWSVCLLEASDEIGGGARTIEATLPGFRHDVGAAFLPLAMVAPAFTGRDLGGYGLRLLHAPLPSAHPFPGNQAIAL